MSEKKTFVTSDDVETQVFDWGRLSWLCPFVLFVRHFSYYPVYIKFGILV